MAIENGVHAFFEAFKAAHPSNYQNRVLLGDRHLAERGAPPRTVVGLGRETFGAPVQNRDASGNIRKPLLGRETSLTLYLWGKDVADCEELLHSTITTLKKIGGASVTFLPSAWAEIGQGSWLTAGEGYELNIQLEFPVLPTETFVTPESFDFELAIEQEI